MTVRGSALRDSAGEIIPIRWGGEELLVLLPGADKVALYTTAERVRVLVENSWIQQGETQARVTVSIGATMALPTETADDLVDRADRLMYASKNGGRNRVTGDSGELVSIAERPLLSIAIPWDMSRVVDLDGFGRERRKWPFDVCLPRSGEPSFDGLHQPGT